MKGFFKRLPAALGVGAKLVAPWLTTGTPDGAGAVGRTAGRRLHAGRLVREFGLKLPHVFMALKDEATFAQAELVHERIADIAIDLYVSSCVLARLDHMLTKGAGNGKASADDPYADVTSGKYFLTARLPPHPRALRGAGRQRRRGSAGKRAEHDREVLRGLSGCRREKWDAALCLADNGNESRPDCSTRSEHPIERSTGLAQPICQTPYLTTT